MNHKTLAEHFSDFKKPCLDARARGGFCEFPTSIKFIDDMTGGFRRGEIWVVSGKTAQGKTTLSLQMARSFAENKLSVLFLSLEMTGSELVGRLFCGREDIDYSKLVNGYMDWDEDKENKFREFLTTLDFEIVTNGYSFKEVEKVITDLYQTKKPDVIFIDFIQLIQWEYRKSEREALMFYIRALKEYANKYNIGFVLISQIRRLPSGADMNREPDLHDMSGSGSIEQMCDKCIIISKYSNENQPDEWYINLAKNRQGRTYKKQVNFIGSRYQFIDNICYREDLV